MKKVVIVIMVLGMMLGLLCIRPAVADQMDILVNKLVEKNILSPVEAQIILDETRQESAVQKAKTGGMDVKWKEGLNIATEDKNVEIKIGGRVYADVGWMKEGALLKEDFGKIIDNAEFRTARLFTSGTFFDHFIYKLQIDFAGGDADFKDVYLGYKGLPYLGTLKVGHFKEPFSLEELISSRFTTFMERALPNAFVPGRNIGGGLSNALLGDSKSERLTWAVGVFRDANDYGNASNNEWNFTGRVTGIPWYEDGGKKLLHLGAAYSYRAPHASVRFRQRPESHMVTRFVDTGNVLAKNENLVGLEAACVYGPLSLQGEYIQPFIDRVNGQNYFKGGYGQISYFLTGEHRPYKNSEGTFTRVKPKKNFSFNDVSKGYIGAWEVAARWSGLDLNNHDIKGGIMNDTTIGINWYLNPNMRIMGNYIHSNVNGIGYADIYQMRFQVDF